MLGCGYAKEQQQEKEMSDFKKAIPGVQEDTLTMRLEIFEESAWLHRFERGKLVSSKPVDPADITTKLLEQFPLSTGLLAENTLWWKNLPGGAAAGIYYPPSVRQLVLAVGPGKQKRYQIPLPGLVFLCRAGRPPGIWAVKRRPKKLDEPLFRAPFPNVFQYGATCGGSCTYPTELGEIPEMFFRSFFSPEGDLRLRSIAFPDSVIDIWDNLQGKLEYPADDLVADIVGRETPRTLEDLMNKAVIV